MQQKDVDNASRQSQTTKLLENDNVALTCRIAGGSEAQTKRIVIRLDGLQTAEHGEASFAKLPFLKDGRR